ncbi:MAG: hypothetical protein WDA06_00955 [Phenylobacterium sp.]
MDFISIPAICFAFFFFWLLLERKYFIDVSIREYKNISDADRVIVMICGLLIIIYFLWAVFGMIHSISINSNIHIGIFVFMLLEFFIFFKYTKYAKAYFLARCLSIIGLLYLAFVT